MSEAVPSDHHVREREKFRGVAERYVEEHLLARLDAAGRAWSLTVPARGVRTVLFRVDVEDRRFLLRCIPNLFEARRLAHTHQYLAERGVRVPRIVAADLSLAMRWRTGFHFLCEEWFGGGHVDQVENREDALVRVAAFLSRMHNHTRAKWGGLRWGRGGSYAARLIGRATRRAAGLLALDEDLAARKARVREWLDDWRTRLDGAGPFNLLHGRTNRDNFLVSDAEVCAIDLANVYYGNYATDLVRATHRLCSGEAEEADFLGGYFAVAEDRSQELYNRVFEFFDGEYHLSQTNAEARRRMRMIALGMNVSKVEARLAEHRAALVRIMKL